MSGKAAPYAHIEHVHACSPPPPDPAHIMQNASSSPLPPPYSMLFSHMSLSTAMSLARLSRALVRSPSWLCKGWREVQRMGGGFTGTTGGYQRIGEVGSGSGSRNMVKGRDTSDKCEAREWRGVRRGTSQMWGISCSTQCRCASRSPHPPPNPYSKIHSSLPNEPHHHTHPTC